MTTTTVLLAPFGDHSHAVGKQRLSPTSASRLTTAREVPVFVGHPDDPAYLRRNHIPDTTRYGSLESLAVRDDGLHATVHLTPAGTKLVTDAHYTHLSPRWLMRAIGKRLFEPTRLLSLGLTNHPNLPGSRIRIETAPAAHPPATDLPESRLRALALDAELSRARAEHRASRAERAAREERLARANLVIANALREGRIRPSDTALWQQRFGEDFDSAERSIRAASRSLKTSPVTANLHYHARPGGLLGLVQREMSISGKSFPSSWSSVKRERPDLFRP